jgi:hypothetical protein
MYRDRDNYKNPGEAVVITEVPDTLDADKAEKMVRNLLDDGEFFTAHLLGVPEVFLPGVGVADHCWHEFTGLGSPDDYDMSGRSTTTIPWKVLLRRLKDAKKNGWDEFSREISNRTTRID